uniref:Solute carrier family 40 member n=1 Tax=Aegilops tauschii subsp. strangulata TaxID=200361 RepID=A0A453IGU3_AEGTS
MPASISVPTILSPSSSSSSTSRRKPAVAAFAWSPGCRVTPPRSLRPNSRFAGSCHTGASSGTSLAEYSGEGASAVQYQDGGPPFVNLSSSNIPRTELTLLKDESAPAPQKGNGAEESTPAYPAAMKGPLVGNLVSSLPLIPTYRSLTVIQSAAHLVSAAVITHAFTFPRASTAAELLLRPWFAVLVASTAVDSLSRVSLGIIAERDFVVQIFLGGAMNRLADGVFNHSEHRSLHAPSTFDVRRIVVDAVATIRRGWREYISQPVLPASLAYVLVCFNVALAPGALMTTFLIHHGASPLVLGAFGGSSALMGILATFMTPSLVKELGILKAGAAGLLGQSALLGAAVLVYLTGSISRQAALFAFLGLIVVSRLGHMAYSVIGLQVVQTGSPMGKAKLIGATEIAVASLAELGMMAVVVAAKDVSRFGAVAVLSAAAVAAAAWLYCAWLANSAQHMKTLFPS